MTINRHYTKSKTFFYFCLSFILGIFIASFLTISNLWLLVFLAASIIIISVFWRNKKAVIGAFCVIFLLFGIYRYNNFSDSGANYTGIDTNKEITFEGAVSSVPEQKTDSVYYEIIPQDLKLEKNKTEYKAKILAILPFGADYRYGDLVEFSGKLKIPEDYENNSGFSYKKYLANKKIHFLMSYPKTRFVAGDAFCRNGNSSENKINYKKLDCEKYKILNAIFGARLQMIEAVNKNMPEPEAGLASAILFGNDKAISKDLLDKFNSTGTRHIMAVSGQNISILVMILLSLALGFGASRRTAFYFSLISIIFYIILIGMPASAVRAGIMGLLILVAERMGRLSVSYRALVFAGVLMLMLNPSLLVFDAGFQLSFTATMGIIFIYPLLAEYLKKMPNIIEMRSSLAMTMAALSTTLPISLSSFGQFSLISPLANILIVPLVPLVMIIGFVIIIINAFFPFLAQIIGWLTWLILAYEIKIVETLSAYSALSFQEVSINNSLLVLYYIILSVIIYRLKKREKLS